MNRTIISFALLALAAVQSPLSAQTRDSETLVSETLRFNNPAVEALLSLPLDTAAQQFHAIVTLIDLDEAPIALPLLEELAKRELSQVDRAALVHRFGSHRMLHLTHDPVLAAVGGPFAEACMAAASAEARDPDRLAKLASQLSDSAAPIRQAALVDLADAGVDGTVFLVESLAKEQDPARRQGIMRALAQMQPSAGRMLLATLSTNNPQLLGDAALVLSHVRDPHALPLLMVPALFGESLSARNSVEQWAPEPLTPYSAEQLLSQQIKRYRDGVIPFAPDANGLVELWFWDDASGHLSAERYPAEEASIIWAARLAEDLYRINPSHTEHRRQCVMLGLESAKLRQGYATRVEDLKLTGPIAEALQLFMADAFETNEILRDALASGQPGAAVAACQLLGQIRDSSVLDTFDGRTSALVQAIKSPFRRVRFAATEAILAIDPASAFAGSSNVPKMLDYFARANGEPSVVIAMSSIEKAATLGGLLSLHGYESHIASTGNELIRLTHQASNLQFVVVDASITSPTVRDVLFSLRSFPETSGIPVALLAPFGREQRAWQVAKAFPCVAPFSRPHSDAAVEVIVEQMVELAGRDFVPPAEREMQAIFAVNQIDRLLDQQHSFYNLRRYATSLEPLLYAPATSEKAMGSLAIVGTPSSQRALLDFASHLLAPLDTRQAASKAFVVSVQRHGVLLTSDDVWQQYERYNASESADVATQQVLGELLDVLETKASRKR